MEQVITSGLLLLAALFLLPWIFLLDIFLGNGLKITCAKLELDDLEKFSQAMLVIILGLVTMLAAESIMMQIREAYLEKEGKISRLRKEMEERKSKEEKDRFLLREKLEKQDMEISLLTEENSRLRSDIVESMSSSKEAERAPIGTVEDNSRIQNFVTALAEKNVEILRLTGENSGLQERIGEMGNVMSAKEEEISRLQEQISSLQEEQQQRQLEKDLDGNSEAAEGVLTPWQKRTQRRPPQDREYLSFNESESDQGESESE